MKLVESTSPIIRTKTTDVTEADLPFVQNQLGLMWKVMLDNNGIGLAATQVGFDKNFFIHNCNETKSMEVVINPTIKSKSQDKYKFEEGCLSLPGQQFDIDRHTEIVVEYKDIKFNKHEELMHNYRARVFQHEIDHLNGICIDVRKLLG
ncbi:MAG: peptide deformylase [Euryarchaeota archaeon]|nr:peptide deformylase [Euryarchaeota archaeon]